MRYWPGSALDPAREACSASPYSLVGFEREGAFRGDGKGRPGGGIEGERKGRETEWRKERKGEVKRNIQQNKFLVTAWVRNKQFHTLCSNSVSIQPHELEVWPLTKMCSAQGNSRRSTFPVSCQSWLCKSNDLELCPWELELRQCARFLRHYDTDQFNLSIGWSFLKCHVS